MVKRITQTISIISKTVWWRKGFARREGAPGVRGAREAERAAVARWLAGETS